MSVVVQLRGGLGNHLFQYAAGYALSQRLNEELLIDTALLPQTEIVRGGVRRWTEQLSAFAHDGSIIDSVGSDPFRRRVAQSLSGRERALGDSRLAGLLRGRVYAHESRDDFAEFDALRPGARINAYCNSRRFFVGYESEIRNQVTRLNSPGEWFLAQREAITSENAVAIHLRWGDYLNLKHIYGTIPASYYRRSLDLLASSVGDRPVWLFSDDPDGAAEYLGGTVDIANVVNPAAESTALENLLLLSSASGMVGANSTFSWWAAWLSSSIATAIFPRPLFAETGPPEPKEWLSADWIQIGRD